MRFVKGIVTHTRAHTHRRSLFELSTLLPHHVDRDTVPSWFWKPPRASRSDSPALRHPVPQLHRGCTRHCPQWCRAVFSAFTSVALPPTLDTGYHSLFSPAACLPLPLAVAPGLSSGFRPLCLTIKRTWSPGLCRWAFFPNHSGCAGLQSGHPMSVIELGGGDSPRTKSLTSPVSEELTV